MTTTNARDAGDDRRRDVALFLTWALLSLVLALLVDGVPDRGLFVALVAGWSVVVGVATRLQALLRAAQRGDVVREAGAPTYRATTLLPSSTIVALVSALPGVALASAIALDGLARIASALLAGLVPFVVARLVFARDRARPRAPRSAGVFSVVVVDGAFPTAIVSAPFGALVLAARLSGGLVLTPQSLARHVAVSIALYAVLLSVTGFAKTWRERTSGLVVTPAPVREAPSALGVGGALAVVALFVVPLVDVPRDETVLLVAKGALSFVCAFGFFSLGALRALRSDPRA